MARILLLDDDIAEITAVKRLVARTAHRAQLATTAADASGAIERDPPDLLVVASRCDGGQALSVVHEAAADGATSAMPVIVLGDAAGLPARVRSLALPIDPEQLGREIERLLATSSGASVSPVAPAALATPVTPAAPVASAARPRAYAGAAEALRARASELRGATGRPARSGIEPPCAPPPPAVEWELGRVDGGSEDPRGWADELAGLGAERGAREPDSVPEPRAVPVPEPDRSASADRAAAEARRAAAEAAAGKKAAAVERRPTPGPRPRADEEARRRAEAEEEERLRAAIASARAELEVMRRRQAPPAQASRAAEPPTPSSSESSPSPPPAVAGRVAPVRYGSAPAEAISPTRAPRAPLPEETGSSPSPAADSPEVLGSLPSGIATPPEAPTAPRSPPSPPATTSQRTGELSQPAERPQREDAVPRDALITGPAAPDLPAPGPVLSTPAVPELAAPAPAVPELASPELAVPELAAPEPSPPQRAAPGPAISAPAVPEPAAPEPSPPQRATPGPAEPTLRSASPARPPSAPPTIASRAAAPPSPVAAEAAPSLASPAPRRVTPPPVASVPPPPEELRAGTLAELPAPRLLALAAQVRLAGRLDLEGEVARSLWFEGGRVVGATSADAAERIEALAVRLGLVTRDQHQQVAAQAASLPARRAALLLLDAGFLKPAELGGLVRRRTEEIVFGIFGDAGARFRWVADEVPADERGAVERPPLALAVEGVRRRWSAPRLDPLLGGPDTLLTTVSDGPPADALALSPEERQVAALADGLRTVHEIERASCLDALATRQVLAALVQVGALAVRRLAAPASPEATRELDLARLADRLDQARRCDYFTVLGLSRASTAHEVREAASRLEEALEPGRLAGTSGDTLAGMGELLQVVRDARDVLGDDRLRQAYLAALGD